MTDWKNLEHAYGPASDIPKLLAALSPDPRAEVWDHLWSCLCHQGDVYPASFAALPELLQAVRLWPIPDRLLPLMLAAAIAGADHRDRASLVQGYEAMIEELHERAAADLSSPLWSRSDFVRLLHANLLFERDPVWGPWLDCLLGGELPGHCAGCDADFYIVIGENGFFITCEEWIHRIPVNRETILPASANSLTGTEARMYELAVRDPELAWWFLHLFGRSRCPKCRQPITIPEAVAANWTPPRFT